MKLTIGKNQVRLSVEIIVNILIIIIVKYEMKLGFSNLWRIGGFTNRKDFIQVRYQL